MLSRAQAPIRLLIVLSIALLGLLAGAIFGYTAAFFAYLWLHPPSPARFEFAGANGVSLWAAVAGAFGGVLVGGWLGWHLTRRRRDGAHQE